MALPNFVIVGAPKCGTSSLAHWLRDHPEIGRSEIKEPFYLLDADRAAARAGDTPHYRRDGLEGYERLFESCAEDPVRFEATTHYLYMETAREVLAGFDTPPKILVMTRQPADRVFSSYQFEVNRLGNLDASVRFPELVERVLGGDVEPIRARCRYEGTFLTVTTDIAHSRYVDYVGPWKQRFGDKLRVHLIEDMRGREREFVKSLASWLDVDPAFFDTYDFPSMNRGVQVRSQGLHRLAREVTKRVRLPDAAKSFVRQTYQRLQFKRPSEQGAEERRTLARLDALFAPSNEALAELIERPDLVARWEKTR